MSSVLPGSQELLEEIYSATQNLENLSLSKVVSHDISSILMQSPPQELLDNIMSRLSVKDSIRFSFTCRHWKSFIHDKDFIKKHHQRSIVNSNDNGFSLAHIQYSGDVYLQEVSASYESLSEEQHVEFPIKNDTIKDATGIRFSTVARSDGLILLHPFDLKHSSLRYLILWNPIIAKHRCVPLPPIKPISSIYGIGYHCDEDDLKVFALREFNDSTFYARNKATKTVFSVYSLASKTWKRIQKLPPSDLQLYGREIVSLNDSRVAWLMRSKTSVLDWTVVTFDLLKEEYDVFPIPHMIPERGEASELRLRVLGDFLCCYWLRRNESTTARETTIWIMKDDSCWMRLCLAKLCEPLFFDGARFLFKYSSGCEEEHLAWYDVKTKDEHFIKTRRPWSCGTIFCVDNFRLLLDGCPDPHHDPHIYNSSSRSMEIRKRSMKVEDIHECKKLRTS